MSALGSNVRTAAVAAPRGALYSPAVPDPARLVPALLAWFSRAARDVPWRHTADPYAIWISEVMLQQTQVATVVPYWTRWMRELPDLDSLAAADPDRVLKLWEGLGYYSRARNLQAAARRIVAEHRGVFPRDPKAVLALPGIGPYTAGAIGSLAFNHPLPAVDGNVIRVLARVTGTRQNVTLPAVRKRLHTLATRLVEAAGHGPSHPPAVRPPAPHVRRLVTHPCGAWNEALMELGALVCTPRQPRCDACPWRDLCVARARGWTASIPRQGPRPVSKARHVVALLCLRQGRLLARRRPPGAVNAGLWELPNLESAARLDPTLVARELFGDAVGGITPALRLRHAITTHRIELEVHRVTLRPGSRLTAGTGTWLTPAQAAARPFTGAHRRVLDRLLPRTDA